MKRPTFILALIALILSLTCCTTSRTCKLSVNRKKSAYYNGLQYRGVRKK